MTTILIRTLLPLALLLQPAFAFLIPKTSLATPKLRHAPYQLFMEVIKTDVAIIGGGPAGCTCALYTSRADLSTIILDKNPASGALAITSHIANYPGVDRSMSGAELLEQMKVQAVQYGTRYEFISCTHCLPSYLLLSVVVH